MNWTKLRQRNVPLVLGDGKFCTLFCRVFSNSTNEYVNHWNVSFFEESFGYYSKLLQKISDPIKSFRMSRNGLTLAQLI